MNVNDLFDSLYENILFDLDGTIIDLYEVINFLEHEWYTDGIDQPPLPFGYHNWLIDPKYKWEDMSAPQSTMPPPEEYAKKFIDNYKQKKLAF